MVGRLRRVLVRRPRDDFGRADPDRWHYTGRPDLRRAVAEHARFVEQVRVSGVEILYHDVPLEDCADAIYVHDPCLITDAGAILLRMGKPLRADEPPAAGRALEELGVPIVGRMTGEGLAEGGDLMWLDERTLAAGQGHRTNREGLRQLGRLLGPMGVEVVPIPLPDPFGPRACLHLMSLISLVDRDVAVIFPALLPPPLGELLAARDYRTVEVPENEFRSMGTNVLALGPGECLMLEGNPKTRRALESCGCGVRTYRGREISLKAEGGPTCLTRAVLRDP